MLECFLSNIIKNHKIDDVYNPLKHPK